MVIYIYRGVTDTDSFIKRSIAEYCKLYSVNIGEYRVIRENGKPRITDARLFCSISHSFDNGKGYTLCAVSEEEVGIDCEKVKETDYRAITERFFKGKSINSEKDFFKAWTAAEAIAKKEEISLFEAMKKDAEVTFFELGNDFLLAISSSDKNIIFCPLI